MPSNYQKKCQFHWISSHSFNRFGPFQARSELQQENRTGSCDRVWGAGIFYCNSWNTLDNCPIKIPSLEGIIYLFHIPRPASHVESLADDTWNQLLSGTYNLWMIHLCPDLVTPQVPGEKERESGQFFEVFLYLNLFCTCKDDMNILQSIVVLSSINVIFASTLGTVVSIVQ